MRRPRQTLAAALLLPLLAGCGGAPQASDPPSPTETTSAPERVEAPSLPSAATAPTRRGAGAFVEHYVDVLNFATLTGDLTRARALSSKTCISCRSMLDAVENVYDRGGSVEGGEWSPRLISAVKAGPRSWVVDAAIRFAPQQVTPSAGAEPEDYPGGRGTASFTVTYRDTAWTVEETTRA